ncbi:MAG: hypothetical protein K6A23_06025 [Butyrivibrio sp.]|nr:hypothetical protein [Butyrivibrio sp.]
MKSEGKSFLKTIIYICVVVFILEIFVFNYRFWESFTYENIENVNITVGEGFKEIGEGIYQVKDKETAYIELDGYEADIKNVYFNALQTFFIGQGELEATGFAGDMKASTKEGYADAGTGAALPIQVQVIDKGHANYHPMPETEIVAGLSESSYIRIYTDGSCSGLRIYPMLEEDEFIHLLEVSLNKPRPFSFSIVRVVILMIIGMIILLFKSSSPVYNEVLDLKKRSHMALTAAVILLQLVIVIFAGLSASPYKNWNSIGIHEKQYEELAKNIAGGHLEMDVTPPEFLSGMDNPYDYIDRSIESIVHDEAYLTDFSYYNGNYYVYFGITPELLFFLPVKLFLGKVLPTWIAALFCSIVYTLQVFRFVKVIIDRMYRETSLGMYLILSSAMAFGTGTLYLAAFGTTYSMPAICGMMLGLAGISLWIQASEEKGLSRLFLVMGAVLLALTIGCRPQYAFLVFLAFPIFAGEIRNGLFFRLRKDSIINTLCVMLPFIIYGFFILYYNYMRFDNPFEFGVTYLLTVNDMRSFNRAPAKLFEGLFLQLIQPLHITVAYPFMYIIDSKLTLQADQYMEPMLGGLFAISPILLFALGIFANNAKTGINKSDSDVNIVSEKVEAFANMKKAGRIGLLSAFIAIFIIVLDIVSAGTSQRYQSDFAIYLMFPALFVLLQLNMRYKASDMYGFFVRVVLVMVAITLLNNMLTIIADGKYFAMDDMNPITYYYIKYKFFRI